METYLKLEIPVFFTLILLNDQYNLKNKIKLILKCHNFNQNYSREQ